MGAGLDHVDAAEDDDVEAGGLFAEINVTPLVDVMLVLLIIFMITAPLMVRGVPIDLPKTAGTALGRLARPVIVSLTRAGDLYLRDEKVAAEDLAPRLEALRAAEGDALAYVRADRGVAYGGVMDLIGRLEGAGFSHVSLLSLPGGERRVP